MPGQGTSGWNKRALSDGDEPAAPAKAFPDDRNHGLALDEYGQRHDRDDQHQRLQARQTRRAERNGDYADGEGEVDRRRLEDAAIAVPPHVARTEQAGPQVGP